MPGLDQVREGEAPAALAGTYVEINEVLRAGFVPLLFRAIAAVPGALKPLWRALRPSLASRAFEQAGDDLRASLALAAVELHTPLIEPALAASGLDVDALDEVRELVQLFHYVDPKLLLAHAAIERALHGERVGGAAVSGLLAGPVPPPGPLPPLRLAPEHPGGIQGELFDEILAATRLPVATTDLRALARYPDFLATAWEGLSPVFRDRRIDAVLGAIARRVRELLPALPGPIELAPDVLPDPQARARLQSVIDHLGPALPRLALLASVLRVALDGPEAALDSPFGLDWDALWTDLEPAPPP